MSHLMSQQTHVVYSTVPNKERGETWLCEVEGYGKGYKTC